MNDRANAEAVPMHAAGVISADAEHVAASYTRYGVRLESLRVFCELKAGGEESGRVYACDVPAGDEAFELWRSLRALHPSTGLWPVLMGPEDDVADVAWFAESPEEPGGTGAVAAGMALDSARLLRRLAEDAGTAGEEDPDPRVVATLSAGVVPDADGRPRVLDNDGILALVPAVDGWAVPGLLAWNGACNYGVAPAEHVAVLRRWHARYGADLAALTLAELELVVAEPPTSPAVVAGLAREAYAYCPDAVWQGVDTVEALAANLSGNPYWYFWWD